MPGSGLLASYLPSVLNNVWDSTRDFAYIKLPNQIHGFKNILGITSNTIYLISTSGWIGEYQFNINNSNNSNGNNNSISLSSSGKNNNNSNKNNNHNGGEITVDRQYQLCS